MALLEIRDLVVAIDGPGGAARVVDGVSFEVEAGEIMGLVGESGSGKSTLARAMLRLVAPTGGRILFDGTDVATMDKAALLAFRRRVQMIFQDPVGALNPRLTVRDCLDEVLRVHGAAGGRAARVAALMEMVGLGAALADRRPRALSGGQCQRVGIARALAVGPDLVVADEVTAALDVSIQAQILNLLADLKAELGLTLVFISHTLAVVRHICDRVVVMNAGRIVEEGPTEAVLASPREAYTRELIAAMPTLAGT